MPPLNDEQMEADRPRSTADQPAAAVPVVGQQIDWSRWIAWEANDYLKFTLALVATRVFQVWWLSTEPKFLALFAEGHVAVIIFGLMNLIVMYLDSRNDFTMRLLATFILGYQTHIFLGFLASIYTGPNQLVSPAQFPDFGGTMGGLLHATTIWAVREYEHAASALFCLVGWTRTGC